MASITLNFPTPADLQRAVDAACGAWQYQAEVRDPEKPDKTKANPQSRDAFFVACVAKWIAQVTGDWEADEDRRAAAAKGRKPVEVG